MNMNASRTRQAASLLRRGALGLLGAALLALPLAGLCAGEEKPPALPSLGNTLPEVEKALAALSEPFSVVEMDMYRDGGTVYFKVGDADGKQFVACMEGRADTGNETALYVNVPHPSHKGGLRLPTNSPAETALLGILKKLVSSEAQSSERLARVVKAVEARRAKAGKFAGKAPLTKQEAIEIARTGLNQVMKDLVDRHGKAVAEDNGDFFKVIIYDAPGKYAPGEAAGVGWEASVAKETRELVGAMGRYVPGE